MFCSPRLILLASWLCVISAEDSFQLPPCEQIAANSVMCTFDRFKQACPKECGGKQNNGNSGKIGNGNNGKSGNGNNGNANNGKKANNVPEKAKENGGSNGENEENKSDQENETTTPSVKQSPTRSTADSKAGRTTTKSPSKGKSNKNCNKVDPCVDAATANNGFNKRCQAAGIAETCQEKCRYDITFDEMKKALLSKQCPINGMRDYLKAGANGQDNRQCCEKTGVLDGKKAFCHPFCNPGGSDWPTAKEAIKYMPCSAAMNAIMRCHWAALTE